MKDLDPILQQYGSVVREIRRERRLSQEELAHQSGLHRTYITDIERGARNVSLRNIIRIADALKYPLSEFFARFDLKLAGIEMNDGPVTILCATNDENTNGQFHAMLEQMNICNDIHVARNGEEVIRVLLSLDSPAGHRTPAVVLLDQQLTAQKGCDVLQELQKDPRTLSISVIYLASGLNGSDLIQLKHFGVQEVLSKPLSANTFSAVMQRLGYCLIYRKPNEVSLPKIRQNTPLI